MTDSADVATQEPASVPALVTTPAVELTADDIALPKVKLGQFMSGHVKDGIVPAGSIFTTLGPDDPDPIVLWEQGDKELVEFYVLAMRKGKSVSDGGELVLFQYDDPDAPADAWVTYNYVVAIPKADEELPYTFLLTRTGKPAAQNLNMVIAKNAATAPAHALGFSLDCVQRENKKGTFFVPRVKHTEADEAAVKIAADLAEKVNAASAAVGSPATPSAKVEEPDI